MAGAYAGAQCRAVEMAVEKCTHLCGAVFLLAHVVFDSFGIIKIQEVRLNALEPSHIFLSGSR